LDAGISEACLEAIEEDVWAEVTASLAHAHSAPWPAPETVNDHVFVNS